MEPGGREGEHVALCRHQALVTAWSFLTGRIARRLGLGGTSGGEGMGRWT